MRSRPVGDLDDERAVGRAWVGSAREVREIPRRCAILRILTFFGIFCEPGYTMRYAQGRAFLTQARDNP